jgi:3-isopropylmalate/(R)-2-methylmalate dehydratase small subunit
MPGFDPQSDQLRQAAVIVTRRNFGCGSSREHAPWVLEVNGIHTVIAESYARIFRQNMFNCGMLAIELPAADIDRLFALADDGPVAIAVDVARQQVVASVGAKREVFAFAMSLFDQALVEAGGWVEFADQRY